MSFNEEKFKSVLHYIIKETSNIQKVFKTSLYKMLYFSDFNFYEKHNKLITGEIYKKLPRGPAPIHFQKVIDELKKENKVRELRVTFPDNKQGHKFISLIEPHYNLTSEEINEIDNTIKLLSSMSSTQVSEYSHGDTPWKVAKDKNNLDPEYVFYRIPLYSAREQENENI